MAIEKWSSSHRTIVPLAIETSSVAINRLVLVAFGRQLDNQPIGDKKISIAFRLEEWRLNFFNHRLFTNPIGDQKTLMAI
jgi:hypothetical protein